MNYLLSHLKNIRKCLDSSCSLSEVSHLLVNTKLDVRDTCVVESFLEVRILHLLRIAELLHEEYKTLSAALLNHVSHELATAVLGRLRIIKKDIVIHVCKLFSKSSESILLVLRNICTEGTALMSNIISCDRDDDYEKELKALRKQYDRRIDICIGLEMAHDL